MSRVRIYELAKEFGVENKDVISRASALGIAVEGHLTLLDTTDAARLRDQFRKEDGEEIVKKRVRSTVIRRRRSRGRGDEPTAAVEAAPAETQEPVEETKEVVDPAPEEAVEAAPDESVEEVEEAAAEETPVSADAEEAPAEAPVKKRQPAEKRELKIDPEARPTATQAVVIAAPPAGFTPPGQRVGNRPGPRTHGGPPGRRPGGMPGRPGPRHGGGPPGGPGMGGPPMPDVTGRGAGRDNRGGAGRGAEGQGDPARRRRRTGRRIVDQQGQNFNTRSAMDEDFGRRMRRGPRRGKGGRTSKTELTTPKAIKRVVKMDQVIPVAELAQQMSVKANTLIKKLMEMSGEMVGINQMMDFDTVSLIAEEFGFTVENVGFDLSKFLPDEEEEDASAQAHRCPVITIMGHVDHGKTSLLDHIREEHVADGEAGGITQHIGAYRVAREEGDDLVFLDTPGHEAFTAMRARGAQVTDIVVLVVAADDGVMPQTIEAINHSKAAEVPIIVAVNKIDKENAEPDRVLGQLAEHDLTPEDWGGDIMVAKVSAHTGEGVDQLLEMMALQAEILELKANPDKPVEGVVVESSLDKGRGPVATVLVKEGTMRVGDQVVCGTALGRVRAMMDHRGTNLQEAGPSTPVQVLGFGSVPPVSEAVHGVTDEKNARAIVDYNTRKEREKSMGSHSRMSLDALYEQIKAGEVHTLNAIVKCDVQGTIEALKKSLAELEHPEVKVDVIHAAAGGITESDVSLASASDAIVIGFNVRAETAAKELADAEGVEIHIHHVIYDAINMVKSAMEGLLTPDIEEKDLGKAEVRETFSVPKQGTVAGCAITSGLVRRNARVRLYRENVLVWTGLVGSLRRFKDDVKEVKDGYECGVGLDGYNDIKVGDLLEFFEDIEVAKTID